MDFASLLAPGAAPAATPAALFGAPAAPPAAGEAFAEAFAQAMTEIPVGVEGLPIAPVSTEAALTLPDAPTPTLFETPLHPEAPLNLDVPPSLGPTTNLGPSTAPELPSAPKAELSPTAEKTATEVPEAPKEETATTGLASAAAKPGRRRPDAPPAGGPDLPTCPTATFPTDGPNAPLPDCPPAPGEGAAFLESEEASTETPDDLDPLDEGDGFARALSTPAAPSLVGAVPAPVAPPNVSPAPHAFVKTAPVEGVAPAGGDGAAASASVSLPVAPLSAAPVPAAPHTDATGAAPTNPALPDAADLGIVPQVTVTTASEGADPLSPPLGDLSSPNAVAAGVSSPAGASPQPPAVAVQSGPPQATQAPAPAPTGSAAASKFEPTIVNEAVAVQVAPMQAAPLKTAAPKAETSETKVEASAHLSEPILEFAASETSNDGGASPDDAPRDPNAAVVPTSTPADGVRETAATARPEVGTDRPNVDRHVVVRQVADRIESMVAARPRDGVTIHMEPRDLGTVTLVVKGIASALDVQVIASDDRVRQSLDASRPELAQALAPRGIGLREVRIDANPAPSNSNSSGSTSADAGSGGADGRSRGGSSQPQSQQQNASAFRNAAPAAPRPRAARATGRGVDLLV